MNRLTVCWIDYYGNEIATQYNSVSTAVPVFDAITGITNADWTTYHQGAVTSPSLSAPTTGPYGSVGDVLACIAIDLFSFEYQFMIPAPILSIFGGAWNSADIGNADFNSMALEANNAFMVPQSGHPVHDTPKGWLMRHAPTTRESFMSVASVVDGFPQRRLAVVWGDSFGQRALHMYTGLIDMSTWLTYAAAISNAIPLQTWESVMNVHLGPAPAAAPYAGVKDAARLVFDDAAGNRCSVMVPAPKLEIFLADGKTVDRSNEGVGAVVAAVLAHLVAPQSGAPLVRYVAGILVRSRAEGLG